MEAEIKKWGGSKAVIVPDEAASRLGLSVGDKVEFALTKKNKVDGFGLFAGAKVFVREDRLERNLP